MTLKTVRDCGTTGGKEFGETAGGLTCVRQIETGVERQSEYLGHILVS